MKISIKRMISFFLAAVMCVSALPVSALAAMETDIEILQEEMPVSETALPVTETEQPEPVNTEGPELPETEPAQTLPPVSIPEETVVIPEETAPVIPEQTVPTQTQPATEPETAETEPSEYEATVPESDSQTSQPIYVSLEIKTLPRKVMYQVNDTLDLTGLELYARDAEDNSYVITLADGIQAVSCDLSQAGRTSAVVEYGGLQTSFVVYVHTLCQMGEVEQPSEDYPESAHPYSNNMDTTYVYTCPGAQYLELTFSGESRLENSYDKIYIMDASDTQVGNYYTGTGLAGKTITVQGDTAKIRLKTDGSYTYYGFSLSSIVAYVSVVQHEPSGVGIYTRPQCFVDGYTTHSCWICGTEFVVQDEGSAAHSFSGGSCTVCGLPENYTAAGQISESLAWAVTEDKTLHVAGTGAIPDNVTWDSQVSGITSVVVGEGITALGTRSFYNFNRMTAVSLPNTLLTIGTEAFYNCSALTRLNLPESVTQIGNAAFRSCSGLRHVYIPASVVTISGSSYSNSPFYGCNSALNLYCAAESKPEGWGYYWNYYSGSYVLNTVFGSSRAECEFWLSFDNTAENIVIPEGITSIPGNTFYNFRNLKSVTLPSTLVTIGDNAFYGCRNLETVRFPASLRNIGASAFYECDTITAAELPTGLTQLGSRAFYGCDDLAQVTAMGLDVIPEYAFYGCKKLASVRLSNAITRVEQYAFYDCETLEEISVSGQQTEFIGNYAFAECEKLQCITLSDSICAIGEYAFHNCRSLETVDLPDALESIGRSAFQNCVALSAITLPEGLETLGYQVFYGCFALTQLRLPGSITTMNRNGLRGPLDGSGITKVIFGDGFTQIPAYALSFGNTSGNYASRITEVVFEAVDKIQNIGSYAFAGCVVLEEFPEIAGLKEIGSYAFQNCTGLTEVNLPEGLETLSYGVFYGCSELTELRLPGTIHTVYHNGSRGPLDGSGINKVIFGDGFTQIPAYILSSNANSGTYMSRIEEVEFEAADKIESIGGYAFYNCRSLETFAVPEAVKTISDYAFTESRALTQVTFPETLETIGSYAFQNCVSLTTAQIPETVTRVNRYAFYACSALESITVAPGQTVGDYAYRGCTSAASLVIGDDAVLGDYAFQNCTGLRSIVIGSDVTMGQGVFSGVVLSGSCGDNLTWSLTLDTGALRISGTGAMAGYSPDNPAPWSEFSTAVKSIDIDDTVQSIGDYAFYGCEALEYLVLSDNIQSVGVSSFADCDELAYIEIPDGVDRIGENAFDNCAALEQVVFLGDAPVLENNCFGSAAVDVHYPETASGFIQRIFERFIQYVWRKWDDTIPTKDVVILLDTSGSMGGKERTLSSASTQLLRSIGGAMKKTNIAVVEYESNPSMLCNFTTNTYRLVDSVSSLYASGGTNYSRALNQARNMLSSSTADIKFVIMFSDGEPGDNVSSINSLANTMREEGIVIYTVGLLSSNSQRQVLINVAGSETRYFEASNIAGLIAAFEELSENFGKSEYSTVEMKVNDMRWDLFNDPYTLCLASSTTISIYLTPGTNEKYDNVTRYALEQNGQYVLTNETGSFENILPSDYFQDTGPIYTVMLDAQGNVIERKELLLTFSDSFKVTYVMGPDMDNRIYMEEEFIPSNDLEKPDDPTRIGYSFEGWYASENCEGMEFFNDLNYHNRLTISDDLTLYAKWEAQDTDITMGTETWTFTNNRKYYDGGWKKTGDPERAHYEMTTNDYLRLVEGLDDAVKGRVDSYREKKWGGSCFGMSSAVILANEKSIVISKFPEFGKTFTRIGDASMTLNTPSNGTVDGDDTVGNIESMINFYHMRQKLPLINSPLWDFSDYDESANAKEIVQKMIETDAPVAINLRLDTANPSHHSDGYHTVVGFDLQESADGYEFKVYDCSLSGVTCYPVTISVLNDQYTVTCTEWESRWKPNYNNIHLGSALSAAQLRQYSILTAPNVITASFAISQSPIAGAYELTTNYGNFTISDGSSSAVISNGEKVSGNLDIACHGAMNWIDSEVEYRFEVPVLAVGERYTISQNSAGMVTTSIYYQNTSTGFFLSHSAPTSGTITFGADGRMETQYTDAVNQEMHVTYNNVSTPWYTVKINGESTGFTVTPNEDSLSVVSAEEVLTDITVKSDFNELTLNDVPLNEVEAQIQENEGNCIVIQDDQVIAGEVYGYSVAFNSQMGTAVETLRNVPYGSLIAEPIDPTKTGYIFQGWFIDEDYTQLWDFENDTVTADMVLYAGWSIDSNYLQSVTFRIPGCEDQIVYVTKGDKIPAEYAPLGTQGEMLEWYLRSDYNSRAWDFENDVVNSSIILYGKTTLRTVSFQTNTDQALESVNIYSGMAVAEPTGLEKPGYTLCGWYTDAAFTQQWDFANDKVSENMTLHARWLENIIDKNGRDTGICIEIVNENSYVYTGKAIKPDIKVWDDGGVLTLGTDYTVSYKNNTNACDKDNPAVKLNKLPAVVVQGKGNYKANKNLTTYFTIHQADMKDLTITVPESVAEKAGSRLQKLTVSASTALSKVPANAYTVSYYMDAELTQNVSGITVAGDYYVVLEAKQVNGAYTGNFRGVSEPVPVRVVSADRLITSAKITLEKTIMSTDELVDEDTAIRSLITKVTVNKVDYTTNGTDLEQFKQLFEVTAVDTDGTRIAQDALGKVIQSGGKKTIYVSAKDGNPMGFAGEKSIAVTVKGVALNKKQFVVSYDSNKVNLKTEYNGRTQVPAITTDLEEGRDYTVTYTSGKVKYQAYQIKNAGTYKLEISGIGAYSGKLSYSFTISPTDIAKAYRAGQIQIATSGTAVYSPSGAKLNLNLSYITSNGTPITVTEGAGYTLRCSGNTKVTETATATITGKGNFKGTLNKNTASELIYRVTAKDLADQSISITVTGATYKNGVMTAVKFDLYDSGKKVAANQYVSSIADQGDVVELSVEGKNLNYTGSRKMEIEKKLISVNDRKNVKAELVESKFYYTGRTICPEVRIQDLDGMDISEGFDISYGTNTYVGAGTVVITGKPDMGYYGVKTIRFVILPKWAEWLFG